MQIIRFFLAAKSTACKYKANDKLCDGQAKLRRTIKNGGEEYNIGCDKWVREDKWHRYIKVPEEIDLELLRDIFQGRVVNILYNLLLIYVILVNCNNEFKMTEIIMKINAAPLFHVLQE
jgi:hypothetical protein